MQVKKIYVDRGKRLYNRSMKLQLQDNDTEIYLTNNGAKSVVSVRFVRTLMNETYKYITLISKNMYIDKLDDKVNAYNNIYHRTTKMKPADVKSSTYIDFSI